MASGVHTSHLGAPAQESQGRTVLLSVMKEELPTAEKAAPTKAAATSGIRRFLQVVAFWMAIPLLLVFVAILMAGHWVVLPKPSANDLHLRSELGRLRGPGQESMWLGVHVLYSDCGCSRRVLKHLFETTRPAGIAEKLLLVGAHPEFEAGARQAGIEVQVLRPRELKEVYGLEAAPLFIVADPDGELRYVGGYTERKRGLAIRDLEIIQSLQEREQVGELPLFGCAVSQRLQDMLDPIGLKYSRSE